MSTRSIRVVVGVDGSRFGFAALHEAVVLAVALGAGLHAVVAWQRSFTMYDAYYPDEQDSPAAQARRISDDAVEREFGSAAPEWFTLSAVEGEPKDVLITSSAAASYLVVGSRGRGGLTKSLLGSVTLHCTARARCPVVVVGPEASSDVI